MNRIASIFVALLLGLSLSSWAEDTAPEEPGNPRVRLETSLGDIVLELNRKAAPKTVENFLSYVRSGFYDGTIFHRVIRGFMIQAGGLTKDMGEKPVGDQIKNEADNGLKNRRGSVAMARRTPPHSASAQFFINTVDNHSLNYRSKSTRGWGYCVFGEVTEGMDVVFGIERVDVMTRMGHENVPITPVVIKRAVTVE